MPIGKTALVRIRINANSQIGIVIVTEIKCRHTQCMLELYFYKKRHKVDTAHVVYALLKIEGVDTRSFTEIKSRRIVIR